MDEKPEEPPQEPEDGLTRMPLAHDPSISMRWPNQPAMWVFEENQGKQSTFIPPSWGPVKRYYYEAHAGDLTFYATFAKVPKGIEDPLQEVIKYLYGPSNPLGAPDQIKVSPILLSRWPAYEGMGLRKKVEGKPQKCIIEKVVFIGDQIGLMGVDVTPEESKDPRIMKFLISLQVKD